MGEESFGRLLFRIICLSGRASFFLKGKTYNAGKTNKGDVQLPISGLNNGEDGETEGAENSGRGREEKNLLAFWPDFGSMEAIDLLFFVPLYLTPPLVFILGRILIPSRSSLDRYSDPALRFKERLLGNVSCLTRQARGGLYLRSFSFRSRHPNYP